MEVKGTQKGGKHWVGAMDHLSVGGAEKALQGKAFINPMGADLSVGGVANRLERIINQNAQGTQKPSDTPKSK